MSRTVSEPTPREVVVAFVTVALTTERLVIDEEAFTMIPTVVDGVMAFAPEKDQLEKLDADPPTHTPFTAKQPFEMLKPFAAVVEPVFEIEKRVVVAVGVEEPIAKRVVNGIAEVEDAWMEIYAYGEVDPNDV